MCVLVLFLCVHVGIVCVYDCLFLCACPCVLFSVCSCVCARDGYCLCLYVLSCLSCLLFLFVLVRSFLCDRVCSVLVVLIVIVYSLLFVLECLFFVVC